MSEKKPRAYVAIVNYRRWRDTVECLESVLRSVDVDFRIVVCENGSDDDSWTRLLGWASGEIHPSAASPQMAHLSQPPAPKPVDHLALDEARLTGSPPGAARVTFIRSARNRGFAGGSNLCLRHALRDPKAEWLWLLNNDTVVEPDALVQLTRHMEGRPGVGMCGSTVIFYDRPDRLQAKGGARYNPWLGTVSHLGENDPTGTCRLSLASPPDYVLGASLMTTVDFVKQVGFLCEDYFLYFEEVDWAARAAGRFEVGYAPGSIVYHKEGVVTGNARARPGDRPAFADYCGIRSRLLFTRRFHPWAVPTVCAGLLGAVLKRAGRGQWRRIPGILRLMATLGGARGRIPEWMSG